MAVGALIAAMTLPKRRTRLFAGLLALCLSSLWIAGHTPPPLIHPGVLEFTAIDVRQADSSLIVTPQGKTVLTEAAGPLGFGQSDFDLGEGVLSPYLWARGISRLDRAVLTHGHSDHVGGMRAVLENFKPQELWVGPVPPNRGFLDLPAQAKRQGIKVSSGRRFLSVWWT